MAGMDDYLSGIKGTETEEERKRREAIDKAQNDVTGSSNPFGAKPEDKSKQPPSLDLVNQTNQEAWALQQKYGKKQDAMQDRAAPGMDWAAAEADRQRALAARGEQDELTEELRRAIKGEGPSVAEKQMLAGRDANIKQALAMAASARGGAGAQAAAQRQALNAGQAATQQTVQQAAMLRAQEQMQARQEFASLAAQKRAADLQAQGLSAEQARAVADNEARQRAQNDAMTQAYLSGETGMMGGRMGQSTDIYSAQSGAAQAQAARRQQQAQYQQAREDRIVGGLMQGAGTAATIGFLGSDVRLKTDVQPVDYQALNKPIDFNTAAGVPVQSGGKPTDFNALGKSFGTTSVGDAGAIATKPRAFGSAVAPVSAPAAIATAPAPAAASQSTLQANQAAGGGTSSPWTPQEKAALAGAAGSVAAGLGGLFLLSDEEAKQAMKPGQATPITEMLDKLRPYAYEYKPEAGEEPGQRYGIMAQDLAQSDVGKTFVERDPKTGYLAIDVRQGFGPVLAAEAELNKRLRALEAAAAKKGGK